MSASQGRAPVRNYKKPTRKRLREEPVTETILEPEDTVDVLLESAEASPPQLRSVVHDHFTLDSSLGRFCCNHCGKSYKKDKTASTGGRMNHLEKSHKSLLLNSGKSNQTKNSLLNFLEPQQVFTKEKFVDKFVEYILLENEAFRKSKSVPLRKLFKICNSDAELPGRNFIRSKVTVLYKELKQEIATELKDCPSKISFVVDGWGSSNKWSFLGIIGKWVSHEWKLKETVIDLTLIDGSHSGKNICEHFVAVLKEFQTFPKLLSVTCDDASNMDTFCTHLKIAAQAEGFAFCPDNHRVRCLAHVLNLCCQSILLSLKTVRSKKPFTVIEDNSNAEAEGLSIVGKVREGIKSMRGSSTHIAEFRRHVAALNMKKLGLIMDVKTRWNYTYYMLRRAIKLKKAYESVLRSDASLHQYLLEPEEWDHIEIIMKMLQKFEEMTLAISKEGVPSMAFCSMVSVEVYRHLESYLIMPKRGLHGINPKTKLEYPDWVRNAANEAYNKLDKFYPNADAEVYIVSTVLNPSYKLEWYTQVRFPKSAIASCKRVVKSVWEKTYKPCSTVTHTTQKNDLYSRQIKPHSEPRDELERYLETFIVSPDNTKDEGALIWWKSHESDYPKLAKMARDYMPVFGTGVPVERLFSDASNILETTRCSMKPSTIKETLCTKLWLKLSQNPEQGKFSATAAAKVFEFGENEGFFEDHDEEIN